MRNIRSNINLGIHCFLLTTICAQSHFNPSNGLITQPILSWLPDERSGVRNPTKAYPPLSPHSDNQSFHYRKQPGCLFLITSLSCLGLEVGSRRGSCTTIFAGTEVSQQLIAFQILFAIVEHDCIVCFFHSS